MILKFDESEVYYLRLYLQIYRSWNYIDLPDEACRKIKSICKILMKTKPVHEVCNLAFSLDEWKLILTHLTNYLKNKQKQDNSFTDRDQKRLKSLVKYIRKEVTSYKGEVL